MSSKPIVISLFLSIAAVWAQAPSAPSALTVPSATSKQVVLSWKAADGAKYYAVQRKSGGDYATVFTSTDPNALLTTATDKTIDPYTTYTYRVVAVNDSGPSGPSGEVTVGPPPFGFNVVIPTPPNAEHIDHYGAVVRMALDANGDPALTWVNLDPNNDGDDKDDTLFFINWNRALYKWNDIVKVAVIGAATMEAPSVPISLARDADTNLWGLACQVEDATGSHIDLLTSADNGITWKAQHVTGVEDPVRQPSLALGGGQVYLAYERGPKLQYVTGKASDDPTKWTTQPVPLPGGYTSQFMAGSLALDSAGNPGIAYMVANDSNSASAFWRPAGGGSPVIIADNSGHANDNPDISLAFFGTEPRVAMDAVRDDQYSSSYDHTIWATRASGSTWLPPVNVPSDGETSVEGPLVMASGSQGQAAIALSTNGGVDNGVVCGYPKIATTGDFAAFKTCALALKNAPYFGQVGWPVLKFGGNDKLWVAFQNADTYAEIGIGVVLWRQP